jgi:hypothetical protein
MSRDAFSFDGREQREPENRSASGRKPRRIPDGSTSLLQPGTERTVESQPQQTPQSERKPETLDSPHAYQLRDRTYFLRESELHTLREEGIFRAVAAPDLARDNYGGDSRRMEREVRRLKQQDLVTEKSISNSRDKTIRLFALTRKGMRLVRKAGAVPEEQPVYHGFVKPREAKHDAELYRVYNAQVDRIVAAGGRPTRVLLDFELKRNLHRDLATVPPEELTDETREQIAERQGLAVVSGKIPVPDLRVEYETADLEIKQLDLELATRNYRPRALAEKAKAGFSLYALRDDAPRLRRVLDDHEITAEILSL